MSSKRDVPGLICFLFSFLFLSTSAQSRLPSTTSNNDLKDSVIIVGKVSSVSSKSDSAKTVKYLSINNQPGNENIIVEIDSETLPMTWEEVLSLNGQYLQISGPLSKVHGEAQMVIRDRKQIKILYQTVDMSKDGNWFASWGPQLISVLLGAVLGVFLIPISERLKASLHAADISFVFEDDQHLGDRAQHIWVTPETEAENKDQVYLNRYIHVGVYNHSKRTAKSCRALITKIQRNEDSGTVTLFSQAFPLAWAYIGAIPMDIVEGTTLFMSLTTVDPKNKFLQPQTLLKPLLYSSILNTTGIYKFSILAVGINCLPITADVTVEVVQRPTGNGKDTEFYPKSVSLVET